MARYLAEIAWETKVWVADAPPFQWRALPWAT
ncbi:hypothetical protein [Methylomagnum ishizawai]